ncbi:MAG: plasmid partitioning protein RepB [Phyllobacterium sp.]
MAGPNRKDQLKALFTAPEKPANNPAPAPQRAPEIKSVDGLGQRPGQVPGGATGQGAGAQSPAIAATPLSSSLSSSLSAPSSVPSSAGLSRSASGAVKAMGLSLGGMSRELDEARRLKESLAEGDRVVTLDPALVDGSFVADRLGGTDDTDEAFNALVESLRINGQQVPVLVRPHPEQQGRFQAAYGHRRLAAARKLELPVRAIVRTLTDAELVLAQGKENSERRDLSFIERALFAKTLLDRGFDRAMIIDALSLHKAELSRFIQVAEAVPLRLIRAIGPAPKVGRPRWMALVELLKSEANEVKAIDETSYDGFRRADSDSRFDMVFKRLSSQARLKKAAARQSRDIHDGKGRAIARFSAARGGARIEITDAIAPGFAEFIAAELPQLLDRFTENGKGEA